MLKLEFKHRIISRSTSCMCGKGRGPRDRAAALRGSHASECSEANTPWRMSRESESSPEVGDAAVRAREGMCGYGGKEQEGPVPKAARGSRPSICLLHIYISTFLNIDMLSVTLGHGRDGAGSARVAGRPAEEHARVER